MTSGEGRPSAAPRGPADLRKIMASASLGQRRWSTSEAIIHYFTISPKNKSPVSGAFAMFNPSAMNKLPLVFLNILIPSRTSKSYCGWCASDGESPSP